MDALARRAAEHSAGGLLIGVEASALYRWHPACLLTDGAALGPLEARVYALNPRLVRGFDRASPGASRTDPDDAHLIAERLRSGHLPPPFRVDPTYAPLQRLTRFREHVADNLVREKYYYLSFLTLSFSGFCRRHPFGTHPFGATGIAVLEELTAEQVAAMPIGELEGFIRRAGRGRSSHPEEVAAQLKRAASSSYELPQHLAEPVGVVLRETMGQIRRLQAQLGRIDKLVDGRPGGCPSTRG